MSLKPSLEIEAIVANSSITTPPVVINTIETRLNQITLHINAILEYLDKKYEEGQDAGENTEAS